MPKLIKMNIPSNKIHNRDIMIKDYWQCPECKTEYPEMAVYNKQDGYYYWQVMCNGVEISECPFCKDK